MAAKRIAANLAIGVHGLRRAGAGETFWQFREYVPGEPARLIDWRRSARGEQLYVREREWESSQTVWLWSDLSPSMDFRSRLSATSKLGRAVVLMLALADMLGRGGERVGIPGLADARVGRNAADRLSEALAARGGLADDWPPTDRIGRFSDVVLLSDFLSADMSIRARFDALAGRGASLHLLQIFDPAEETLPYEGRLEFRDPETGDTWLTERAGGVRVDYRARLEAHRASLRAFARHAGSSFGVHHTDRPAAEGLLFLHGQLSGSPMIRANAASAAMGRPAA